MTRNPPTLDITHDQRSSEDLRRHVGGVGR